MIQTSLAILVRLGATEKVSKELLVALHPDHEGSLRTHQARVPSCEVKKVQSRTAMTCPASSMSLFWGCKIDSAGSRFFWGISFGFCWVFFWFYVRGCCNNCKSHKDETNAEAAIGHFCVLFGFAVMGHADRAIERTLSRMTQSRPVP